MNDPFTMLGLAARRDLTDEDVRAAWRRIAAVTHPDLADGGDPGRYSAAAAAYDTLRTAFGRGEALADLGLAGPLGSARAPRHHGKRTVRRTVAPAVIVKATTGIVMRAAGTVTTVAGTVTTVAVVAVAVAVVGWTPASIGLLAGAVTWLVTGWGRWRRGGPGR